MRVGLDPTTSGPHNVTVTTTKQAKIELRVDPIAKKRIQRYARKAGYHDREFSQWARRVLDGIEPHPELRMKKKSA